MSSNVTKLHATPTKKVLQHVTRKSRHAKHQLLTATAIGVVAVTLTALSLNHLASGIEEITGASSLQAWAMAIGVDCAFVACELAQLTISEKLRAKLAHLFRPAIIGTLTWSAVLNALAFASHANSPVRLGVAIALGVSIPALVYILTKIGGLIYLDVAGGK
jgi:hypothetical protein